MLVNTEGQANQRLKELEKIKNKASVEHEEAKKNRNFTQMYPKGWQRVRELLKDKQGISAIQLYSFLAEHIDPTCGAVVCDQQFLAEKMDVSTRTIRRWLTYLEGKNALVISAGQRLPPLRWSRAKCPAHGRFHGETPGERPVACRPPVAVYRSSAYGLRTPGPY